jgi:alkylated DNA nucleotide flippase Atl1
MDVQETALRTILDGTKQYRVPLYQRPYSWEKGQVQRLWDDIERLAFERANSTSAAHFMGSLVLSIGRTGPAGTEFLVVDGQQRLTTLTILLCALRDYVEKNEPGGHKRRVMLHESYLVNRFSDGDGHLKVLPTQADRDAYRAIVDARSPEDPTSNMAIAYRFFSQKLRESDDPEDPHDIVRIEEAILEGLVFVAITARGDDNVYRIFESLNNTGKPLTQGDLLRNYVFMRLGARGDEIYDSTWLPMQRLLDPSDLQQLFWLDIVMRQPLVTQNDVYSSQQKRLDKLSESEIATEVRRWSGLATLLATMRDPSREPHVELRKRLTRLKEWGTTTVDPLVLQLLSRREAGIESADAIALTLRIVEGFLVRRVIVGRATTGINRILLAASSEIRNDQPSADTIREYLSTGRKSYGSDAEIDAAVPTIPFYFQGRPAQRKLVLQWLEEAHGSKEHIDPSSASIEHVLPQTLTASWRASLAPFVPEGETTDTFHASLLHTLGNLTLTAYNSELSNLPFEKKRDRLAQSGFQMNRAIAASEQWTPIEIATRAAHLADLVKREWPGPLSIDGTARSGVNWDLAHRAVLALQPGEWTSYGDLAALIGTHANPMGQHMAKIHLEGAWRVLQSSGTVSPGFRWSDSSDQRDPITVLVDEGVRFSAQNRADASQRVTVEQLAERLGLETGEHLEGLSVPAGEDDRAEKFLSQLEDHNSPSVQHNVLALMKAWTQLGGELDYGWGETTSCVFLVPERIAGARRVRSIAIYPDISVEVGFQHLVVRPPFDDVAMRNQFRELLNRAPGVDISESRLTSRPPIAIEVLADASARQAIEEALAWFYEAASQRPDRSENGPTA